MQTIYDVPVILRREIEALMIKPFLDAFEKELGKERTYEIAQQVIREISIQSGKDYVKELGGNDLDAIVRQMTPWSAGGALELEFHHDSPCDMRMDVKKCIYTQMYERIGMKELGRLLSCGRDEPFYEGLNPQISMTRTETLMDGGSMCDFCFHLDK